MRDVFKVACVAGLVHQMAFATLAGADVILRRGGEGSVEAAIVRVDDAGVTVQRAQEQTELIRWDRFRSAETARFADDIARYQDDAVNLWRARSRLERGDTAMAEPLFERLFEKYRGKKHETALVVAEGLLRCRCARGAHDTAIIPALETIRLRRLIRNPSQVYSMLRPMVNESMWLCSELPPAWINSTQLIKVERDLEAYDAQGDSVVAAIARLYQSAIQQNLGIAASDDRRALAATDPGIAFLRSIVQTTNADPTVRAGARADLERELENLEAWAQAWAHYAIGMSLMMEQEILPREIGMVHLSYVPAQFEQQARYLAGLAVFHLANGLERAGQASEAATLRGELKANHPNHPALGALQFSKPQSGGNGSTSQPASQPHKETS